MNIDISHEDLGRMHRIGKADRNDGKSRPIITKFTRYAVRINIYRNKKKLKGKNVQIRESVAIARIKALKVAQTKYGKPMFGPEMVVSFLKIIVIKLVYHIMETSWVQVIFVCCS